MKIGIFGVRSIILFLLIFILNINFCMSANVYSKYLKQPHIGTEINKAMQSDIPFVLVIANPDDKSSILRYLPIGKMIYQEFKDNYDFCILNSASEENKEYIEFFKPDTLPAVYVVNPNDSTFGRIKQKHHNSRDMKRILAKMINEK